MKTILSLSAVLATLTVLGLLPLALADSKEMKETSRPQASEKASSPAKTTSTKKSQAAAEAPAVASSDNENPGKTSTPSPSKPKSRSNSTSKTAPEAAEKLDLTPTQEDKLLTLLNEGTVEDLDAIPGIAMTRADSIVSARPYASVHEIILVEGVGNATFEKILAFGKTLTQRGSQADSSGQSTTAARKS